jgi:predicted phage tail protein
MTTIRLHGILAQKYGKVFEMEIDKPRDVIRAIDANREGFRKTVVDLQKQGFSYELIVNKKRLNKEEFSNNKKPQEIDFVPFIVGSGLRCMDHACYISCFRSNPIRVNGPGYD